MQARLWTLGASWASGRSRHALGALCAGALSGLWRLWWATCDEPSKRAHTQGHFPVTQGNKDYIEGIQIWGVGIKEDPYPGEKRGKGVQHLRSICWMYDLASFIQARHTEMIFMMQYARTTSGLHGYECYDFRYFVNCSEGFFYRALDEGFHTPKSLELLLMASWSLMAAAEVDCEPFYDPQYIRHTKEEREQMQTEFYKRYLSPDVPFVKDTEDPRMEHVLGFFGLASVRFDLIPAIALERLDVHNELCSVKWRKDPGGWLRDGFVISGRVDSMQRHYWSIHAKDWSEDHVAHGIWNLMALYHALKNFPENNDMINFQALRDQATRTRNAD